MRAEQVEARLRQDTRSEIKAVLPVQIDTSTGVLTDIAAVGEAIKAVGHDALLMVDTVASLACMPFQMDVDVAMAARRMTTAGLGFVAAGERTPRGAPEAEPANTLLGLEHERRVALSGSAGTPA